jgi:N-acetylmuramoyl-L-alanine amidase
MKTVIKNSSAILLTILLCSFTNLPVSKTNYRMKTVIIDAGHGGHDTGCKGVESYEKDVALSIALKTGNYIKEAFPELRVIYTRNNDTFVELIERARIANNQNADLFISVHCNANESSKPFGTETYAIGLHVSEANLRVAQRENSSILLEKDYESNYEGFDPNSPEAYIIFSMYQNSNIDKSLSLAAKVQSQFESRLQRVNRGVKQAGFLVLYKTTMPSILVETGFLTNRDEEQFMIKEENQYYIASAIYRAFKEYKQEVEN